MTAPKTSATYENIHFRGKIEDYIMGKEIGKGAYAVVKKAFHKGLKKNFAMKIYERMSLNDYHKKNTVKCEIEALKRLDNEYIVKFYEVIETTKQVIISKIRSLL